MSSDRAVAFQAARQLAESNPDEALEKLLPFVSEDEQTEYSVSEMEAVNIVVIEKVTSASFTDKKDACNACIPLLENVKLTKDAVWLNLYNEALYDVYSKLSRCARDEERTTAWNQLKEMYYEVTLAAKNVWREKNMPDRLNVYVCLAKLCKSYLDVADEDSIKMCESFAKEAKFLGKGRLEDDDWKDSRKAIDTINKTIADAVHERGLIDSD